MNTIKTIGYYSFVTGKMYANKGLKASAEKRYLAKQEKQKARILAEKVRKYREESDKRIAARAAKAVEIALQNAQLNGQFATSRRIMQENARILQEKRKKLQETKKPMPKILRY